MGTSVKEEEPLPGCGAKTAPDPLDVQVLDDGTDADEQPEGHDEPPQPGVGLGRAAPVDIVEDGGGGRVHGGAAPVDAGDVGGDVVVAAVAGERAGEVGGPLHDQGPLGQRETKARQSSVSGMGKDYSISSFFFWMSAKELVFLPGCDGVAEAHEEKKPDPVKEEGRDEGREEDEVVPQQRGVRRPASSSSTAGLVAKLRAGQRMRQGEEGDAGDGGVLPG